MDRISASPALHCARLSRAAVRSRPNSDQSSDEGGVLPHVLSDVPVAELAEDDGDVVLLVDEPRARAFALSRLFCASWQAFTTWLNRAIIDDRSVAPVEDWPPYVLDCVPELVPYVD